MGPVDRFMERLKGPSFVLMDGAFATELARRSFDTSLPLYSAQALLKDPQLVRGIHRDYLRAGAEVIRADTFCTSPAALQSAGLDQYRDQLTELAMQFASDAVVEADAGDDVLVAGCLSPIGSYLDAAMPTERELRQAQDGHAARLAVAGTEVVFCETMPSVREAVVATQSVKAAGMRAVVSLVPANARHLVSGETLDTAVRKLLPLQPLAICLNCAALEAIDNAVSSLLSYTSLPIGVYASVSDPVPNDPGTIPPSAMQFLRYAERWLALGIKLIGGCCGTSPEHIGFLHRRLGALPPNGKEAGGAH